MKGHSPKVLWASNVFLLHLMYFRCNKIECINLQNALRTLMKSTMYPINECKGKKLNLTYTGLSGTTSSKARFILCAHENSRICKNFVTLEGIELHFHGHKELLNHLTNTSTCDILCHHININMYNSNFMHIHITI
jgi:hypothetical protein